MSKYIRAVSTNFIFFTISVIFFLIITPLAIHIMGEEFYGLWVILSALLLFSNVGTLGIGAIVMKFSSEASSVNESQTQFHKIMTAGFFIVLVMSIVTATVILLIRNPIVDNISTDPKLREQFRLAIFWIAAGIFPQFSAQVPRGYCLVVSRFALWLA